MIVFLIFACVFLCTPVIANGDASYFETTAKDGDGVLTLLERYHLLSEPCNIEEFYRLNEMTTDDYLLAGKAYKLPVLIFTYNGKSIDTHY